EDTEAALQEFEEAKADLCAKYRVTIEPDHEPPPGYIRTFYGPAVQDQQGLAAWIGQQLVTADLLLGDDRTPHLRKAVHNARCLVIDLGLTGLPELPLASDHLSPYDAAALLNAVSKDPETEAPIPFQGVSKNQFSPSPDFTSAIWGKERFAFAKG